MNEMDTRLARNWAVITHLCGLLIVAFPANVIAPIIIWAFKKGESPFLDEHLNQVINFQISMTIYLLCAGALAVILIGIPILLGLAILSFIFPIVGALKAGNDEGYRYPLTIQFLK
jgi:hypothetical protein